MTGEDWAYWCWARFSAYEGDRKWAMARWASGLSYEQRINCWKKRIK